MSFEKAKNYLLDRGYEDRIREFDVSSATVDLAAVAVGTEPARIAKSLTFLIGENPIMILCAGDTKIDNAKFKALFKVKAKMMTAEQVEEMIGHKIGGVCPFGIRDNVKVYLDISLKRFDVVYPACGSSNSAVQLSCDELEKASESAGWIDVCKMKE